MQNSNNNKLNMSPSVGSDSTKEPLHMNDDKKKIFDGSMKNN